MLIRDIAQLTPSVLTDILRSYGALHVGQVIAIEVREQHQTPWSSIHKLAVTYSAEAPLAAPIYLFLKMGGGGQREVTFYHSLAGALSALPVPPCYDAGFSPEENRSHLLLQDLSKTHGPVAPWPMPPRRREGELIVESLARLHAYWWESPRLSDFGALPDERDHADHVRWVQSNMRAFAEFLGDRFLPEHRDLYDRVLAFLPRMWDVYWRERVSARQGVTLIHGDAHPGNLLFPQLPESDPVYLVDWQAYRPAVGAIDVAYMFTMHWYPERAHVMPFLRHYYGALCGQGGPGSVANYPWETFWLDYRMAILHYLFDAPRLCAAEVNPEVWWPIYQRGLIACRELECEELLRLA